MGSAGNQPVAGQTWLGRADDLATVCAAAVRMIADLPVEHLPPGTPAGVSFGVKRTWLAVRGGTVEQIAAAIGLHDGTETGWDDVMRGAAAWSVDPNALSVIASSPRPGLLGRLT
ncbi:hypothetical protein [Actinoplanes awajinensis]|uniref:Uncharacterized protein n=1 Tax=Actinoplanes awajinensis subsp. mycoplanecinus TaxID=135947 RepID=A0A101JBX6_9ACTN|nr:hypothetical protein [Actinoplanes awajinensis]KUL23948.1 hypothetical protein ADL15_44855 [Actinoplanes awajinensis subsp. mycoplanecinus]